MNGSKNTSLCPCLKSWETFAVKCDELIVTIAAQRGIEYDPSSMSLVECLNDFKKKRKFIEEVAERPTSAISTSDSVPKESNLNEQEVVSSLAVYSRDLMLKEDESTLNKVRKFAHL